MATNLNYACTDAYPLAVTVYKPEKDPKGVVIIASAVGVSKHYYRAFAQFLVEHRYVVITFDYRGSGESDEPVPGLSIKDWGVRDIDAAIQLAMTYQQPIYFIGHSIGGQLVGLAPLAKKLDRMIFIASSAPYWRRWGFPDNTKVLLSSKLVLPAVAAVTDEFPTKQFGLGNIEVPSRAVRQWARWMRRPNYLFDPKFNLDITGYTALDHRILSLGFEDDAIAPRQNIEHLLKFFPNCFPIVQMIAPDDVGGESIGHSGFFKEKFKDNLWKSSLAWLQGGHFS